LNCALISAFLSNLGFVVTFATLVVGAILPRHRPPAHKRLMLIATIACDGRSLR